MRAGQITAVVGRNASGKTTLLRIVLGELTPDTGSDRLPAADARQARVEPHQASDRRYSAIPRQVARRLRPALNYVAARHGIKGRRNRELIDWHMERYGLTQYEDAT